MSLSVSDFSRHPQGILEYICKHHPRPDAFREYRHVWDTNVDELLFLLIETTSCCNLRCPMCAHSSGYKQAPPMDDALFDAVLKNLRQMRIPSVNLNQINEPLLDRKIFQRLRDIAAIDSVQDLMMNTNAILLDEDNGAQLLDSGLTRLLISFDGFTKETYERVRVGSNFENTRENIFRFLEMKESRGAVFPVVRLSFVRTSWNEHEVEPFIQFWKDRVDYIAIQEYVSPVLDDSKQFLLPQQPRRDTPSPTLPCNQPFQRAVIRGDGAVLPCCNHNAVDMPIGNLYENSLEEIWRGPKAQAIRAFLQTGSWARHPICGPCLRISCGLS